VIRINLLPVREIEAKVGRKQEALVGGVCLGLVLLIAAGIYGYQLRQVSKLESELTGLQNELQQLNTVAKEVAELQKKVAEFREKNKIIEDLNHKRTGPVKIMEDLADATPARLWLMEFKENGGSVTMNGFAADNQTIAEFLKTLTRRPRFTNVELMESIQNDQDTAALKRFTIKSSVNYEDPTNKPPGTLPEGSVTPKKP
jgi:type IV pilus assembly protein PilN